MTTTEISFELPLQTIEREALGEEFKRMFLNALWNTAIHRWDLDGDRDAGNDAYFIHIYKKLCETAGKGNNPISNLTHNHILTIIRLLRGGGKTQEQLVQAIATGVNSVTITEAERAVKFAACLIVPLNFVGAGGVRRGETVSWMLNDTLEKAIIEKFSTSHIAASGQRSVCGVCNPLISFPKSFNARQICFIAGFEIVWTSNLADHLLILDMDESEERIKLHIFHQVKVLQQHLKADHPILPPELITETLDSLSLLLPREMRSVRRWFIDQQKTKFLDPGALYCDYLRLEERNLEHFKYWGDRLLRLKLAFDGHEPNGPVQWWRDDRKPVQWWTFWIAVLILVLTVIFGFIQSVTSIIQVTRS